MCLPSVLADWFSNELLARRDLTEVWLERGARAHDDPKSGVPALVSTTAIREK